MAWDYETLYNLSTEKNAELSYRIAWMETNLKELQKILSSDVVESNGLIMNKLKDIANSAEDAQKSYNEYITQIRENKSCNDI